MIVKVTMQYAAFVTFLYSGNEPRGEQMEKLFGQVEEWVVDHKPEFRILAFKLCPEMPFID